MRTQSVSTGPQPYVLSTEFWRSLFLINHIITMQQKNKR